MHPPFAQRALVLVAWAGACWGFATPSLPLARVFSLARPRLASAAPRRAALSVRVHVGDVLVVDGEAENFRRLARLDELRKLLRRHRAEAMMDEILKAGVESRFNPAP